MIVLLRTVFARAGLAHDAERLAALEGERNPIDSPNNTPRGAATGLEIGDLEQGTLLEALHGL